MSTDNFSQLFVYHLTATPDPDAEIGTTSYSIRIQVTFGGRKLMEFAPDDSDALIHHLAETLPRMRIGYDWSADNGEFYFRVIDINGERMVEWATAAYGGGDIGAQHTYTPANASFATLLDDIAALWVPEEVGAVEAPAAEFSGGDVHQGRPLYPAAEFSGGDVHQGRPLY